MKYKVLLLSLLTIVLCGCQLGNKSLETSDLRIIDISKNYPAKEIRLQNIADIEYVPIETTDDVLLSEMCQLAYVSDKYILIYQSREGDIFVFNRNGKIATHINHKGQGGNEYNGIKNVIFDEKNEEIFVNDAGFNHYIQVYSLTGEYKRTLKYSGDLTITIYKFDDENLLAYDEGGMLSNSYSQEPYFLLSKEDVTLSPLNIHLPVRYSNRVTKKVEVDGKERITTVSIYTPNNRYYGENIVIADISSDTIYKLARDRELTPLLTRKPSVHSSEPRIVWTSELVTGQFIVLRKTTLATEEIKENDMFSSAELIFDFKTGEINEISFVNDDFIAKNWINEMNVDIPQKNIAVSMINVNRLKTAFGEKQLKGELEKLTATLDEEDNPVLMIVKFK